MNATMTIETQSTSHRSEEVPIQYLLWRLVLALTNRSRLKRVPPLTRDCIETHLHRITLDRRFIHRCAGFICLNVIGDIAIDTKILP